ncbi:DUF1800 domain-containing protein [Phytohabitans flavus]|uniref:DUF1800 domain-containing protein n=1 Tax=Phytohabitans flavus TaxID=1076124 RepID=A0A6F8XZ66_9ACTN|nr:DUF1800 domain-containing protein [Phytohabitans flavus]BCB79103.1 hypothetical protein Pflav_055130 [Phytohabitans flavus]
MTDDVALLLARAGFGPTAAELAVARKTGYAGTLSALLDPSLPDIGATSAPEPRLGMDPFADLPTPTNQQRIEANGIRDRQIEEITRWWLDRMTVTDHQALEKLVFFWHGHWATSVDKVRSPQLMLLQHRTMRGARDFVDMCHKMAVDPALVYWLDGQLNTKASPNENLGRELMELFMLGIGNYTEKDVKEAGRALTGWRVSLGSEACFFQPEQHDSGSKTILGVTGALDTARLVDLLLRRKECPRFVAARMWRRYASSSQPIPEPTREAMAEVFPAPRAMLRVLFEDEAFGATAGSLVKQPVEWLVGGMRQLGLRLGGLPAETLTTILKGLRDLGQLPFVPPSVGGWTAGGSWLTSAAAQVRLALAGTLATLAAVEKLTPDEVAYILCVEGWTDRTYAVLRGVKDPRHLLILAMASPEYLVT